MSPVGEVVILAAGVGKRLGAGDHPKCLLEVGGRTLLDRHLEHLAALGVPRVTVVTGHLAEQIEDAAARRPGGLEVRCVPNPRYREGSVVSLLTGLRAVTDDARRFAWMDADVIYHPEVLRRLFADSSELTFLLDSTAESSGEEMMLGVTGGRVLRIGRGDAGSWDRTGESVGFFAADGSVLAPLTGHLEAFVAGGRSGAEYEEAIHEFLPRVQAGYADVSGLPWTEIDFPEDVAKAEAVSRALDSEEGPGDLVEER